MDTLRSATDWTTTDTYRWVSSLALIANPMEIVAALSLLSAPEPRAVPEPRSPNGPLADGSADGTVAG